MSEIWLNTPMGPIKCVIDDRVPKDCILAVTPGECMTVTSKSTGEAMTVTIRKAKVVAAFVDGSIAKFDFDPLGRR